MNSRRQAKILSTELDRLAESDLYPLHMPGHKRQGIFISEHPETPTERALTSAASVDITEIDGFDNLHAPEGVLRDEMAFAADFYGTKETYFLVDGSTVGILAAISAAAPFGGSILIERGCHISVYHAAALRHLHVDYVEELPLRMAAFEEDGNEEGWGEDGNGDGRGEDGNEEEHGEDGSEEGQEQFPHYDALVVTSPGYEGLKKDIRSRSVLARRCGAVLIVDEAHGAHFSRHPYFPESAVREGADLVIQSMHKTLPSLTQAALLHNVTGRVPGDRIERYLDIYETSSPSYLLLASMTTQIHAMAREQERYFDEYVKRLKAFRKSISEMNMLNLVGGADAVIKKSEEGLIPGARGGMREDPGKIVISTGSAGITGPELYDILRETYHLQPEMKAPDYVLLMTSVNDTEEGFFRMKSALLETDRELVGRLSGDRSAESGREERPGDYAVPEISGIIRAQATSDAGKRPRDHAALELPDSRRGTGNTDSLPARELPMAEAYEAASESVPLKEAAGRISAEFVIVYPPDSPLIVPGEVYSEHLIERIWNLIENGFSVTGIADGRVKICK